MTCRASDLLSLRQRGSSHLMSTSESTPSDILGRLRDELRRFAAERDWDQFHSPKNLASALSVEAAELLEHFQWLTEEQSRTLPPESLEQVTHELADVFLYLIRLADRLEVDLVAAATRKIELN